MVGYKHRISQRFVQKQMQGLGDKCTIVEITREFDTEAYRETTEICSNHYNIPCYVTIFTEGDTSVQEGEARAGDLLFIFDSSQEPYLKQGDRIIYDSRTFQIYDVRKIKVVGNTTVTIECFTKKYSDDPANVVPTTSATYP